MAMSEAGAHTRDTFEQKVVLTAHTGNSEMFLTTFAKR